VTRDETIARANRAKALLDDEVLQDAFAQLGANFLAAWRATEPGAVEDRERLWVAVGVIEGVQAILRAYADSGLVELERLRIERLRDKQQVRR
jgi:hypothetical protein